MSRRHNRVELPAELYRAIGLPLSVRMHGHTLDSRAVGRLPDSAQCDSTQPLPPPVSRSGLRPLPAAGSCPVVIPVRRSREVAAVDGDRCQAPSGLQVGVRASSLLDGHLPAAPTSPGLGTAAPPPDSDDF